MKEIKLWLKHAGITVIGYLIAGIVLFIMGYKFLAGAAFGIFLYVNWNVIVKIWSNEIKPEIKDVFSKVENKIK